MTDRVAGEANSLQSGILAGLIASLAVLIASYWNSLSFMPGIWENPEFSHGYLIPLFAFLLLWHRRGGRSSSHSARHDLVLGLAHGPGGGVRGLIHLLRVGEFAAAALLGIGAVLYTITSLVVFSTHVNDGVNLLATVLALTGGMLLVRPTFALPATASGRWCGVGLLALAGLLRLWGAWHFSGTMDHYSFILAVAGAVMLVGGWTGMRWAWPSVAVLFLMFPFPGPVRAALIDPLQQVATRASTYCLQTVGLAAFSEGNRIVIGELQMGVVEACSGLRMLTVFAALAVAIALLSDRPAWERWVVAISAVPISLLVNVVRISVTGILYQFAQSNMHILGLTVTKEFADHVFHDWAGYFMMPMALGLLFLELQILPRIFLEKEDEALLPPAAFAVARPPRPSISSGR